MRTFLILAALGWVISLPWTALIGLALVVIAIAAMWSLSVLMERRAVSNWTGGNTIDPNYVAALESMVAETEAEVETMRGEIERLRSAAAASEPDPKTALYGRVGLSPSAPEWLVAAARRAYRVALHPDRHPVHWKKEAQHRFQLAERVFDEITEIGL